MHTVRYELISFLLFLFAELHPIRCDECVEASLTQKIENEGFHREVKWLLELSSPNVVRLKSSNCKLALQLEVSHELFVNPDQIADLNRLNQSSVYVKGDVNVETIAHESVGHTVYAFVPHLEEKVLLSLPIHLRYQRAQITGGKLTLPKPSLLVHCINEELCKKYKQVVAPCDVTAEQSCQWRNITYQRLFDETELYVPVGDLDDYSFVSVITLLLGCAGCIYILSILASSPL